MAQHVLPGPLIKILEDPPSRESRQLRSRHAVPTSLALKRILIKRTVYRNWPLQNVLENKVKRCSQAILEAVPGQFRGSSGRAPPEFAKSCQRGRCKAPRQHRRNTFSDGNPARKWPWPNSTRISLHTVVCTRRIMRRHQATPSGPAAKFICS